MQKFQQMSMLEKSLLEKKIPKEIMASLEEVLYCKGAKRFIVQSKRIIGHLSDPDIEKAFRGVFLKYALNVSFG